MSKRDEVARLLQDYRGQAPHISFYGIVNFDYSFADRIIELVEAEETDD